MAHYAVSELLIVLAGIWAVRRLSGAHCAAALGIGLFAAAAFIGVLRFGLSGVVEGLIAAWADWHRFAGTIGGTAAMAALVYDLRARTGASARAQNRFMLVITLALGLAVALPKLAVPAFLVLSLSFVFMVVRHADGLARPPLMAGAMAALMLFNVLVFRQAEWLSAAMSWHIFHVLVALWLVGLGVLLAPKLAQS